MPLHQSPDTVIVRRRMNEHGAMTVELVSENATRHIVEYDDPELRRTLASLPRGATVPVRMERVGARSNVWRATAIATAPAVPVE